MASLVTNFVEGYQSFMEANGDPRTKDWFLMSSPWPLACLLVVYFYGCTKVGPRIMKHREPFKLNNVLVAYNAIQMVGSALLFWEGLEAGWLRDYNYSCQPVDYSDSPQAMRMARAVYAYFLFKIVELLDTVFFVLRKKNSQLSFLHMYHHTLMPICAWIGVRFLPGGHGTLLGLINCLVHVVMYCYYMLAAMGPSLQRYLGWKSWVTVIQLVQFVIVFAHSSQVLFRQCNYPKFIAFLLSLNAVLFMQMFGSFYYRAYILGQRRHAAAPAKPVDKPAATATALCSHTVSNGNGVMLINNNNVLGTKDSNGKLKAN